MFFNSHPVCLQDLPLDQISVGMEVFSKITHRKGKIIEITKEFFDSRNQSPWIKVKWESNDVGDGNTDGRKNLSFFPHFDDDYHVNEQPWRHIFVTKAIKFF